MDSVHIVERQRRALRATAGVILISLLAAACGSSSSSTTGPDGVREQIHVWVTRTFYVPPDEFKSFEEEYGVDVVFDIQSNDDILQQWQRMKDAGQKLPDVVGGDDSFLVEGYVEAGLLRPIDDIVEQWQEEDPELYEHLLPIVWDETTVDGTIYGASIVAGLDTLYYNAEWFEDAGVTLPIESLDELLDVLRAMKEARPDSVPLAVQAKAGEGVTSLKTMLAAAGVEFDGAVPDLTSEAGLYVLDWWQNAAREGLLPPDAIAWGEDETRGAFVAGNGGLIIDSFTAAGNFNQVENFKYPDQWAVTTLPLSRSGGGVDGVAISGARMWAISSDASNPDLAGKLIRYIAETDNLVEAAGNGSIPMRQTEALNDPRIATIWPFFDDALKEAYINSVPAPAGPNAGQVESILEQMFGEIVAGTTKTASELAEEYQALLDNA